MTEEISNTNKENQPQMPVNNKMLDSQLQKKNILVSKGRNSEEKPNKDLMIEIRNAKDFQKKHLYGQNESPPTFSLIQSQMKGIVVGNEKIEDQIKMDVLGIQDKPLARTRYHLIQFVNRRIRGKPQERAENLITNQLNVIGTVTHNLSNASEYIDRKILHLEDYYDLVLFNLMSRYEDRKNSLKKIEEDMKLLSETEKVVQSSSDFSDKVRYSRAHRKLRRETQNELLNVKISDKAMLLLKNELPLLDNLGEICGAYSNALKETSQEAAFMSRHLENVMELYFNMMRSQRINMDLEKEVKKLFAYTNNMNNSLRDGAALIVEKANQSDLFTSEYTARALTLESVVGNIEGSNSNSFRELERRIAGYLT